MGKHFVNASRDDKKSTHHAERKARVPAIGRCLAQVGFSGAAGSSSGSAANTSSTDASSSGNGSGSLGSGSGSSSSSQDTDPKQ